MTYEDGALVACGFGTAWQGVLRGDVSGRDRVLVTGLGPVGLATLMLSIASGAEVIGVDVRPERRAFAMELGAAVVFDPEKALDGVRAFTRGAGVEVAIDCSAAASARANLPCERAAVGSGRVRRRGRRGDLRPQRRAHPSPAHVAWLLGHRAG